MKARDGSQNKQENTLWQSMCNESAKQTVTACAVQNRMLNRRIRKRRRFTISQTIWFSICQMQETNCSHTHLLAATDSFTVTRYIFAFVFVLVLLSFIGLRFSSRLFWYYVIGFRKTIANTVCTAQVIDLINRTSKHRQQKNKSRQRRRLPFGWFVFFFCFVLALTSMRLSN